MPLRFNKVNIRINIYDQALQLHTNQNALNLTKDADLPTVTTVHKCYEAILFHDKR